MKSLKLAATVALAVAAGCSSPTPPAPQVATPPTTAILFEGARLITGDGGEPIDDSAFLVEGDRLTSVGKKGQVQLPAGATRIDLTGKTVMPALVDAHSHLGYTDVKRNTTSKENFTRENLVDHLK